MAEKSKGDTAIFIGAFIGAVIGVYKMGFLGLIMVFPGMLLAALLPSFKRRRPTELKDPADD